GPHSRVRVAAVDVAFGSTERHVAPHVEIVVTERDAMHHRDLGSPRYAHAFLAAPDRLGGGPRLVVLTHALTSSRSAARGCRRAETFSSDSSGSVGQRRPLGCRRPLGRHSGSTDSK